MGRILLPLTFNGNCLFATSFPMAHPTEISMGYTSFHGISHWASHGIQYDPVNHSQGKAWDLSGFRANSHTRFDGTSIVSME